MEPFIKLTDVSRMTGIPKITLRRWLREGKGPFFRRSPAGTLLFRKSDVEAWVDALETPSEPRPDVA